MSEKRFLQTLQALLTMVDPDDPTSVACVKNALESIYALAMKSRKSDSMTLREMMAARRQIDNLIHYHEDFAGRKGDYNNNVAKQQRLKLTLVPSC